MKSLAMWLVLLTVAVLLGGVRDTLLAARLNELRAHQLETVAVCVVHFILIWLFVRQAKPTRSQCICIGGLWTVLLIAFEYGFFHLLMGLPLQELIASLDLRSGRLFSLVVATVLFGPIVASHIQSQPGTSL